MTQGLRRILLLLLAAVAVLLVWAEQAGAQARFGVGIRSPRGGVFITNSPYGYYGPYATRYGYYDSPYYAPYYRGNYYDDYGYYGYRSGRRFMPYASDYYYGPSYAGMPRRAYQASYPPEMTPAPDLPVHVQVRVPAPNAEVWFGTTKTAQTGTMRMFVSPPVAPNRTYTYEIRARWMKDGQPIEQTRSLEVQAGQRVTVEFKE